jgi:hypothetical protein
MRTMVSYTATVAVRVVLADDVADDTRRLLVGAVPVVGQFVHREQHAPMHRLEAVAHIGERPPTITLIA